MKGVIVFVINWHLLCGLVWDNCVSSLLQWSERWEMVVEKIDRLDAEVDKYKEQIKKTRPGPAQEVVKARARRKLKQKRA